MAWQWEWSWASRPLGQPWQSLALGFVGLLLLTASAYDVHRTLRFLASAHVASGTVVDLVVRQRRGFYPVFTWVDETGQAHRKVSNGASTPPRFDKGQTVRIYYTPSNTDDALIDDFFEIWFFALITGVLGAIFSAVSVLLWIYRRAFFALAGYPELADADTMAGRDKRRR